MQVSRSFGDAALKKVLIPSAGLADWEHDNVMDVEQFVFFLELLQHATSVLQHAESKQMSSLY